MRKHQYILGLYVMELTICVADKSIYWRKRNVIYVLYWIFKNTFEVRVKGEQNLYTWISGLFIQSQLWSFSSSWFTRSFRLSHSTWVVGLTTVKLDSMPSRLVSSANNISWKSVLTLFMPLMYTLCHICSGMHNHKTCYFYF